MLNSDMFGDQSNFNVTNCDNEICLTVNTKDE